MCLSGVDDILYNTDIPFRCVRKAEMTKFTANSSRTCCAVYFIRHADPESVPAQRYTRFVVAANLTKLSSII